MTVQRTFAKDHRQPHAIRQTLQRFDFGGDTV